ncbi:EexN family lipoprotein [Salmonella enterica]|nr:EexN family lipoprotein [Salmonella enterica]
MKKLLIALSLITGAFTLSGCGDKTHDVDYFKANQEEMKQVLAECQKQSRENWSDNCKNANEADVQIKNANFFGSSKKG